MTFAYIVDGGGVRAATLAEADAAYGKTSFVWVHLDGRDRTALDWLAAETDLPDVALSALTAYETRPRSDVMDHGALINLRAMGATPEDDPDALVSIRIWAERGWLTSVSMRTPLALEPLCQAMKSGRILDPGDLISTLAQFITDQLDPDVAALGDLLDDCETELSGHAIFRLRRQISRTRSQAIAYRRFVSPQRQALERLAGIEADWLDEHDRLHLREAADRCARMAEELEAVRERSALMHEQLTDLRAEQIDQRALLISIVALVFLPLTFLTGLLGMNVPLPLPENAASFWWVVGACAATSIGISAYFIGRHWVSR